VCAEGKLTTEEKTNKFLISTDHKERTVWHVAANCNKLFFREFMLIGFMLIITEDIYIKLLLATDRKVRAVWQVLTERHYVEISEKLRSGLNRNIQQGR